MSIVDSAKQWLFTVALKKGVKMAVAAIVSILASAKVAPVLTNLGVSVDPGQLEIALAGFGITGITMLLNYLKVKFNLKFL